ncbi:hypothetical protein SAMN05216548_108183 [Faunimonas pinastri]|uniref:HigA2-like helix-turn-helix domain-containing protein n=1 Tax=Faunimonas pinastri TaxID=1855383 RepID=A0A1H9JM15_9HYPH|nr:XRE family transcriptional regulator [Faunimonas pinastri]SEQ87991.1 hypothetical protein SAMN05216548_108183 [Faunimonas pinastri]
MMGGSTPILPNRYQCVSAQAAKDVIGGALANAIQARRLKPSQVAASYSRIRAGEVGKILDGDWQVFGINRLMAIGEALGVQVEIRASGSEERAAA